MQLATPSGNTLPLRIDLDFLDTSGYVVLPIESALRPLDASQSAAEVRPHGKVEITQTLGRSVLTARGVIE